MCHVMCSVSTLGKIFSRRHTIFLIFPRKQHLTFHAKCAPGPSSFTQADFKVFPYMNLCKKCYPHDVIIFDPRAII